MTLVFLWQFARRRETPARWLLGLSLLSIPLCILLSSTAIVRDIGYPQGHSSMPKQLSIAENGSGRREFQRSHSGGQSHIAIPVVDRSIDSDTIVNVEGFRAVFSGQDWRWEAPWKNRLITLTYLSPGTQLEVEMPEEIANRIAQEKTSVSVEVAFNIFKLDAAHAVDSRASEFDVPGVGRCRWFDGRTSSISFDIAISGQTCVAPLRLPSVRVIQIDSTDDACPLRDGEAPVPPGHFTYAVEFGTTGALADFDPNPVRNFMLVTSPWIPAIPDSREPNKNRAAQFCRGTRFTVRTGRSVQSLRATSDLGDIGNEKLIPNRKDEDYE
jgi:hypothetical protein